MKRLVQGFVLILGGLVAGLLCAEAILRVGFRGLLDTEQTFTRPDPVLGWRHRENWKGVYRLEGRATPIVLNNHGMRNEHAVSYVKPPGTKRLLLLGDSLTAAFEVNEPDTFAAQLARRLRGTLAPKVEVLNAGVRGWGTDQAQLLLEREGVKYHPDVVIYAFVHNDLFDNLKTTIKANYTFEDGQWRLHYPDGEWLQRKHFIKYLYVKRLVRLLKSRRAERQQLQSTERRYQTDWFNRLRSLDPAGTEWKLLDFLLREMDRDCRRIGARFYVIPVVMPMEYDDGLLADVGGDRARDGEDAFLVHHRLALLCEDAGLALVPALPAFRRHYHRTHEFLWWKTDNHYNPRGHALTAQLLADAILHDEKPALAGAHGR